MSTKKNGSRKQAKPAAEQPRMARVRVGRTPYVIPKRVRVNILGYSATSVFRAMAKRLKGGKPVYTREDGLIVGQSKLASPPVAAESTVTTVFSDANNPKWDYRYHEAPLTDKDWAAIDAVVAAGRTQETDLPPTPEAIDLDEPPPTISTTISRKVRDSRLSREVKRLHGYQCQICGETLVLADGSTYAEGHNIQPLGKHEGRDKKANLLCLCPNHHALCDFGAIRLDLAKLRQVEGHKIGREFIDYHNTKLYRGKGAG